MKRATLACLVIAVLAVLVLPNLLGQYAIHILVIGCYYASMATSWNLLTGYGGQMSFAHVSFATFAAYVSTILTTRYAALPVILSMLTGAVAATALGWCLGVLCLRMKGIYHSLTTIAFAEIFRTACNLEYRITNGAIGMSSRPLFGASTSKVPYFYAAVALLAVTAGVAWTVVRSPVGLTLKAMRNDQTACMSLGVDLTRLKLLMFVIVSFLAGLSGAFLAHYTLLVSPETANISEMSMVIAMSVIGGLGTFWGPIIGALGVEITTEYVRNFGEYHLLLFGVVLVVVLRFTPSGLLALAQRTVSGLRKRKGPEQRPVVGD